MVSYPDPNVRNDDYRLQYNITYAVSDNAYVRMGLGTRLPFRLKVTPDTLHLKKRVTKDISYA